MNINSIDSDVSAIQRVASSPISWNGGWVVVRARAKNALYVLVLSVDVGVLGNFALLGRRLVCAQIWSAAGQID